MNNKYLVPMLFLILFGSMVACSEASTTESSKKAKSIPARTKPAVPIMVAEVQANQNKILSTVVIYQESEKGITPYFTRYVVNSRYMRVDDGKANTGFVLLDRKKNTIYSVSVENESILYIKHSAKTVERSATLLSKVTSKQAPKKLQLEGKRAKEYELTVNGKACRRNMAVKGVLPDFVAALKQYKAILASQHASNLFKTPINMRDNCFMVYNIFEHQLHTSGGLIVRSWNDKGSESMLRDFRKDQKASAGLFVLPKKYSKFTAGQVP